MRREEMKKPLTFATALAALISPAAVAQTLTPDQLAQRTFERRAVEAVNWGMSAVNYDLMMHQEVLSGKWKFPEPQPAS
jgi:hypothetical protein